jgi:hypothetical protein
MPVKTGKWGPAKLWWQVYKNNEKIFLRGEKVKFTTAGEQRRRRLEELGIAAEFKLTRHKRK